MEAIFVSMYVRVLAFGAQTRVIRANQISTMLYDLRSPYVPRPSAAMVLNMEHEWVSSS